MPSLADIAENDVITLDQVDRDILVNLQNDGRSSASHIASEIGMSIPAVTDRIKKLQESGIIMGFTAVLNHRKVGLDVSAFITVISESSSHYSDVVRKPIRALRSFNVLPQPEMGRMFFLRWLKIRMP